MAYKNLTSEDFRETVSKGIVLVDFWAPWCGPCRRFGPIFEAASENHPEVVFGKVNTDEQQKLATEFGIQSIPTLMAFRDGVVVFNQPGALAAKDLDELVEQIQNLDMDEVRKQIDK